MQKTESVTKTRNETAEIDIRESSFRGENEKLRAARCVLIVSDTITAKLSNTTETKLDEKTYSAFHNSGIDSYSNHQDEENEVPILVKLLSMHFL